MSRARDNADLGDSYGSLAVGVTGGSGLNAVSPANLASGVLPVGVTGGTGLSAHGTVTAGNISHADIVYPTGHVLQTVAVSAPGRVNSNNEVFGNKSTVEINITPRRATSNILLMANFAASTAATYAYFDFYKNASDVTETFNLSGMSQGCGQTQVESPWISISLLYLDELAENSTTEKTYSITSKSSGDAQTYLGGNWTTADMSIVAMEIAV